MTLNLAPGIEAYVDTMKAWRRDIHAHPETAFEEVRTAALVAEQLKSFGLEVHTGFAKTGVVGVLDHGDGPAIGLRADMDALFMDELTGLDYASIHAGKMHACGHDGHTAMLLGAAKYLSETKFFKGRVVFIFQPAEEGEGGAKNMVEEGLFEKFPVDGVYGLHNWPGMDVGTFAVTPGPIMAAYTSFEARIQGQGAHGGMPHLGVDPVVVAAQVITAWQGIVSRTIDPQDAGVISVTQIHAGDAYNVIPDSVELKGAIRSFREAVGDHLWTRMKELASGICTGYGADFTLERHRSYPATINSDTESGLAAMAAADVVGHENVDHHPVPSMGAEDFAYMLEACPGSYVWMGNGPGTGGCLLHNPKYDFNDEALAVGASYWVKLVGNVLAD
ncbi:M20 aminoacylase family protein [Magnetovibrio sp. PR-2]|uniref:M20 aminoacylase family protein n=1 Tax=Magnetovibrio sp. PR-2 TaxID=3120356 RepID=UPI002FCE5C9B